MQYNRKPAIFVVLMIIAVFIWVRKDGNVPDVSSASTSAGLDQTVTGTETVAGKRTEFVDWGRDPFTFPQREGKVDNISNLTLLCIILSDKEAQAFINESIVRVGDRIADKTVRRIEQNRVILTDGTRDYVLELRE